MTQHPIDTAIALAGGQAALAHKICVAPAFVYQWRKSLRRVPAEHCPAIERATSGAVRCEDLRPDVDWAYLRGTHPTDGLPPEVTTQQQEAV